MPAMPAVPAAPPAPAMSVCTPRAARAARAEAMLRQPALPPTPAESAALSAVLGTRARRTPRALERYVHAFGVCGPAAAAWASLFSATARAPEALAVLLARAACGGAVARRALFGRAAPAPAPGILHKVCALYDDWLLSVSTLRAPLVEAVDAAVELWQLCPNAGRYVWCHGKSPAPAATAAERPLGDSVQMLAARVAVGETRRLLTTLLASGTCALSAAELRSRVEVLTRIAKDHAAFVLATRLFECAK